MPEHIGAAGGEPFERRKARAEVEAGRPVVGVTARDAAIDQQSAKRHDEGLQVHPGDEEAVHQADEHAAPTMISTAKAHAR